MSKRNRKRKRKSRSWILPVLVIFAAVGVLYMLNMPWDIKKHKESKKALVNPLMGYAPGADGTDIDEDVSLLYMDITWRELEPEKGVYAWEEIEKENQLTKWRETGRHIVLRFVLDKPGEESHMDIPDWLYEETGEAGNWYDMEYGKGFSPDYANEMLIAYHERAVQALGRHFGQDGFVSYIELGSLGHWGEWHVKYTAGIKRLPGEEIRLRYIEPWQEAFPEAMILMRRPFAAASEYGFGLFNDMAGEPEATAEWLSWIEEGGAYEQTREKRGLMAMPDFWKTAPSGGEFTSAISMEEMLDNNLEETLKLVKKSHTTFLGPKTADPKYAEGYDKVLKNMGYRLWISKVVLHRQSDGSRLKLTWQNTGSAPMYKDWEVRLYILSKEGEILTEIPVDFDLREILPGDVLVSETAISMEGIRNWKKNGWRFCIGILDPMTGEASVKLAIKGQEDTVQPVILE